MVFLADVWNGVLICHTEPPLTLWRVEVSPQSLAESQGDSSTSLGMTLKSLGMTLKLYDVKEILDESTETKNRLNIYGF